MIWINQVIINEKLYIDLLSWYYLLQIIKFITWWFKHKLTSGGLNEIVNFFLFRRRQNLFFYLKVEVYESILKEISQLSQGFHFRSPWAP